MRTFEVKYRNGKFTTYADTQNRMLTGGNISASTVRQILDAINPELRKVFGDYTWTLQGESGAYFIVASAGRNEFIEGRGKTPQAAFWDCYQIRHVMNK